MATGWQAIRSTCPMALGCLGIDQNPGKRLRFRFGYIHQPVSLGRRDAVIQFTRADDSPRRWFLTGRLAVLYKEFVTSSPPTTYQISKRLNVPAAALSARGGRANRRGGIAA